MPRGPLLVACALGACLALASDPAAAQQRPLVTEDPATVDNGFVLLEAGLTVLRDQPFPVSGLTGRFWSVPTLGISIGVGDRAEVQIDNVSFDRLRIAGREPAPLSHMLRVQGDTTGSWSDAVIGAKTRLVEERPWLPAIGLRFATKPAQREQRGRSRPRHGRLLPVAAARQDDPVGPASPATSGWAS